MYCDGRGKTALLGIGLSALMLFEEAISLSFNGRGPMDAPEKRLIHDSGRIQERTEVTQCRSEQAMVSDKSVDPSIHVSRCYDTNEKKIVDGNT